MANKKQNIVTTEVFIQRDNFSNFERAHLLEHVHFLEERMNKAEKRIEILGDIFTGLLELEDEDDDDYEEEFEEDEEDEDEEELENFFNTHCVCSWMDDDEDDEND